MLTIFFNLYYFCSKEIFHNKSSIAFNNSHILLYLIWNVFLWIETQKKKKNKKRSPYLSIVASDALTISRN